MLEAPRTPVDVGAVVEAGAVEDDTGPVLAGELKLAGAGVPKIVDALEFVAPGAVEAEDCAEGRAGILKVTPDVLDGGLLLFAPSTNGVDEGAADWPNGF